MAGLDTRRCERRAAFTAFVIACLAPAATSFSIRYAVGIDVTDPDRSLMPDDGEIADRLRASAIAAARSASIRPRSWTRSRRVANAHDSPPVRPVLSASARSSTSPACDTTPGHQQ